MQLGFVIEFFKFFTVLSTIIRLSTDNDIIFVNSLLNELYFFKINHTF